MFLGRSVVHVQDKNLGGEGKMQYITPLAYALATPIFSFISLP
jgi:hypothetical protein